jgi:uncharacterized protein with ATP-grasp and redox domains
LKLAESTGSFGLMNELVSLPPPIVRAPGGFADFTVARRFPKIGATAIGGVPERDELRPRIEALVAAIVAGDEINTNWLEQPTPFWSRYVGELRGARWNDLPFFDIEFVFYLALNSLAGRFRDGTDVFRDTRRGALQSAISVLAAQGWSSSWSLADAIWFALVGNEADYSQLANQRNHASAWEETMVVDQRPELLDELAQTSNSTAPVHVIADNAGPELVADLVLADALLARSDEERLVLHCKPWPMFVSDALVEDVQMSIDALRACASRSLRATGERLQLALASTRLRLEAHCAWGEPRHFDALGDELSASLRAARVVIAKGDLNYRRFVGDRDWPAETPTSIGSQGVPFRAYALRVLKSDALVGVPHDIARRAAARNPSWRTDGSHALVQRLGSENLGS